jgi:hypothetical protein
MDTEILRENLSGFDFSFSVGFDSFFRRGQKNYKIHLLFGQGEERDSGYESPLRLIRASGPRGSGDLSKVHRMRRMFPEIPDL